MQPLHLVVAPGVPTTLITRPLASRHVIERPALWHRVESLVQNHRVTAVVAPAGYGKTTLLTTWAAHRGSDVAWLTLSEADQHPRHLARVLQAAMLTLPPASPGSDEQVLVIDDVHLAGDAGPQVLMPLIEAAGSGLRIVLVGRGLPGLRLTRLIASGDLGRLTADDLSFTADEVDLVGRAVGHPISSDRASRLWLATGGWPVVVRLSLIASASGVSAVEPPSAGLAIPEVPEYLIENVLASLPPDLHDFVLVGCVCDWLTAALAEALAGVENGADYLERALAAGLPLERRGSFGGEPLYRWHPVMARAGREILLRRDPERYRELNLIAARTIGAADAFGAAAHALTGRDPALAAQLIRSQWLAAVLRGDSDQLAALCGTLPGSWSQDPEILAITAACRRNAGDLAAALDLEKRAILASSGLADERVAGFELTRRLARLFTIDDAVALGEACLDAEAFLTAADAVDGALHASALFLLGWTELRLRRVSRAQAILVAAEQRCQGEGLDDLADRAHANSTFALAFAGDFAAAEAALAATEPVGHESGSWRRADGGIEWFTRGWMHYWRGELAEAFEVLSRALDQGGGMTSYAPLSRCWLVDAAVESGDPAAIARAEPLLGEVATTTIQGLPWGVYRAIATAGLLLSRGRSDEAAAVLDDAIWSESLVPAAHAQAAGLYWRCGRADQARRAADIAAGGFPGYLRIGGLVVAALCERAVGMSDQAHRLLEEALAVGATQGLLRPFAVYDPALTALLIEHADQGTAHEAFLAQALSRQHNAGAVAVSAALSERETEVLGLLQTRLSAAEIAAALHISMNTLKTHVRSIYRKLGATSRREAIAAARRAHD